MQCSFEAAAGWDYLFALALPGLVLLWLWPLAVLSAAVALIIVLLSRRHALNRRI